MSAVISECGLYRYRLERDVQMDGITIAYFGINPSKADAQLNDATVRKWAGFTKINGGRRFIVGNVFGYRATDVSELRHVDDPRGPDNMDHLYSIIDAADILVPCWGNSSKVPNELRDQLRITLRLLGSSGKPMRIFGRTLSGDPKHPLMLSYSTPLVDWF